MCYFRYKLIAERNIEDLDAECFVMFTRTGGRHPADLVEEPSSSIYLDNHIASMTYSHQQPRMFRICSASAAQYT